MKYARDQFHLFYSCKITESNSQRFYLYLLCHYIYTYSRTLQSTLYTMKYYTWSFLL